MKSENKKQEVTLSLKEAKELYKTADSTFKKFLEANFERKELVDDICEVITSLEDVFNTLEEDMEDYLPFKFYTKDKRERYLNACSLIPKIVECYNEGWKADFSNSESKYLPYYKLVGSRWVCDIYCWCSYAYGPACHHYKNTKLLLQATKIFNQIYIDYFSYMS